MAKVAHVDKDELRFDDGSTLCSDHDQDCCEHHYLNFGETSLPEFEGLEFDLSSGDSFFEKVEDYGIRLVPVNGHPISIPGYGSNNGYYSHNLTLVLKREGKDDSRFDVSSCQVISD